MKRMTTMPPTLIAVERATAASRGALVVGIALVLVAASLPFWGESSWMREFVEIACYFIFAMMWNLLAGYGGMVSIGQQAFFGFGGYVMLMLGNFAGLNPFVAIPLGALAAGLIAIPVSFVAFRLSGGYFAIGTWVIITKLVAPRVPALRHRPASADAPAATEREHPTDLDTAPSAAVEAAGQMSSQGAD